MLTPQEVSERAFQRRPSAATTCPRWTSFWTFSPGLLRLIQRKRGAEKQDEGAGGQGGGVPLH